MIWREYSVSRTSPRWFWLTAIGSSVTRTDGVASPPTRMSWPFRVGLTSCSRHVSASSGECGRIDFANVIYPRHLRPVVLEHGAAPRVTFYLQHGLNAGQVEAV